MNTVTILKLPSLKKKVGLSRSSIYALMSDGQFPKNISLGRRAVGWIEAEIDSWLKSKIENRDRQEVK